MNKHAVKEGASAVSAEDRARLMFDWVDRANGRYKDEESDLAEQEAQARADLADLEKRREARARLNKRPLQTYQIGTGGGGPTVTIGFAVGVGYDEGDLPDDLRDKDEGRGSDSPYCVWDPAGAIVERTKTQGCLPRRRGVRRPRRSRI
jgi:hypothetical protein